MVGPYALAVCRAHRGLPVGFLLLRYSVLFTVDSLSLLYFLFIYLDLYEPRHAIMCLREINYIMRYDVVKSDVIISHRA